MQKIEQLNFGYYYHIYNRGINGCNLFQEPANYEYFLRLYDKYIYPIADTFAWVLMPNHFHFMVRIKAKEEIEATYPDRISERMPSQKFSNLFNSYAQAFNKRFNRHGSLFERPFERKHLTTEQYMKQVILYIHNNPVHHNFCSHPVYYPWSSYHTCISTIETKLKREQVISWFGDLENFKYVHNLKVEAMQIEKWLGL